MPLTVLSLALAAAAMAPLVEGGQIGPGWHVATLPNQTKPVTRFAAERIDDRAAVRIDADHSYGNLVFDLANVAAPKMLRWSWRLQTGNPGIDLKRRGGDDTPAKVCLAFDVPLDAVPFGERQLLRMARSNSTEPLPTATLCWVWGGPEAKDALLDNAFTRRVRYIVLRNAGDAAATWFDESRDVAADFKRAFGDESATVPAVTAVLIGGDADNTATHTVAHVGGLRLEP